MNMMSGAESTHESMDSADGSAIDVGPIDEVDLIKEIVIVPKGDLILEVGEKCSRKGPRRLLVESDTLKRFGPRWKQAIAKSERDGLFSRRRILRLPDDDADMMLILMWLSHAWHMNKVPARLSFRQLFALTFVCEQFDMNLQVSRHIRSWLAPYQQMLLTPGREQWLQIAHQFGLKRHYATLAMHLVANCRTDEEGNLLSPGKHKALWGRIPQEAYRMYMCNS